jgi:hypothetical protein
MLAYVFWHRPDPEVGQRAYEQRLLEFHTALLAGGVETASFRLEQLPFGTDDGYEDWYLVDDWAALGSLNQKAIERPQAPRHDAVADLAATGWGGIYALLRGSPHPPRGVRWAEKPRAEPEESFLEREQGDAVWRRQLVLGPAPEFCFAGEPSPARVCLWPR